MKDRTLVLLARLSIILVFALLVAAVITAIRFTGTWGV